MPSSSPAPFPESCLARAGAFNADFKDPVYARPANAERFGDGTGSKALRLHLAHPDQV